jgi:hypothetical protein
MAKRREVARKDRKYMDETGKKEGEEQGGTMNQRTAIRREERRGTGRTRITE